MRNEMSLEMILKREKELKNELLSLELKKEEILFKSKKNEILKEMRKINNFAIRNPDRKIEYKKQIKLCKCCSEPIDNKGAYRGKFYCSTTCKRKDYYYRIEKQKRALMRKLEKK